MTRTTVFGTKSITMHMIFSLKKIREASLLTPRSSVKSSRPSSIHSAIAILITIAFSMHMNASRTRMTVVNSMLLFHRSMTNGYGNYSMKCATGLSTTSLKPPPTQITQTESNRPWAIKYNHPGPVATLLPAHNINITIRIRLTCYPIGMGSAILVSNIAVQ